jgi:hypothetical protein
MRGREVALGAALALAACQSKPPVYTVDKSSSDWVVVFQIQGVVRAHQTCGATSGWITEEVRPGKPLHVKPGQWLEWIQWRGLTATVVPMLDLNHC